MRQCAKCGKGSKMVGSRRLLRAHYNPVNWIRKYPNIQWAKIDGKRARVCVQCLKALHKAPRKIIKTTAKAE